MNEIGGVVLIGQFSTQHQTTLHVGGHLGTQVGDILTQIINAEGLLMNIRCISASGHSAHCCQITTIAAHCLDHEDTTFSTCGTLFDFVNRLKATNTGEEID